MWWFRFNFKLSLLTIICVLNIATTVQSLPDFQISLPIEILRLHITSSVGIGCREYNNVRRYLVFVVYSHKISNLNVLPIVFLEPSLAGSTLERINETTVIFSRRLRILMLHSFVDSVGSTQLAISCTCPEMILLERK